MSEAETKPVAKPEVAKPVLPPLAPRRMRQAEVVQQFKFATAPNETTPEDLLRPEFWAHCARELVAGAEITVVPEDGSFYAKLYVRDVGRAHALCALIDYKRLAVDSMVPDDAGYEVRWGSPMTKYRVIRLADKAPIHDGFASKLEGQLWLAEHLKAFR